MQDTIVESDVAEMQALRNRVVFLERDNARLICAEREKEIALDAVQGLQDRISQLENERDYAKMEATRAVPDRQELQRLQKREASILAIAAVPHEVLGPYEKLALIVAPAQVPYSAELHGGKPDTMLTSMGKWNKAICGVSENSNTLNRALVRLEACKTVIREKIDTGDGKTHYKVEINEQHLQHPRFIAPGEARPHNGGNKRCPQCGEFCKKKLAVSYECVKCGIDFDAAMLPISHGTPAPAPAPVEPSKPSNVIQFAAPELPIMDIPAPRQCFQCGKFTREFNPTTKIWRCQPCWESEIAS